MHPPIIADLLAQIPAEERIYHDLSADIVVHIRKIMSTQGITQAELAARMGKRPSEIHKMLSFGHNLTLQSIAKLTAALGTSLVQAAPSPQPVSYDTRMAALESQPWVLNEDPVHREG